MTSRAEYRLILRQDNSDARLTPKGRAAGLVKDDRWEAFLRRQTLYEEATKKLDEVVPYKEAKEFIEPLTGGEVLSGLSYKDMIKRGVRLKDISIKFGVFCDLKNDLIERIETDVKYEGYVKKELELIARNAKLKSKTLPTDTDYMKIDGLRVEARQKLNEVKPLDISQAERIPGVNPADIAVLMVWLKTKK